MLTEEEINDATLEYFCDTMGLIETYEELNQFFEYIDIEEYKKIIRLCQEKMLNSGK